MLEMCVKTAESVLRLCRRLEEKDGDQLHVTWWDKSGRAKAYGSFSPGGRRVIVGEDDENGMERFGMFEGTKADELRFLGLAQ